MMKSAVRLGLQLPEHQVIAVLQLLGPLALGNRSHNLALAPPHDPGARRLATGLMAAFDLPDLPVTSDDHVEAVDRR